MSTPKAEQPDTRNVLLDPQSNDNPPREPDLAAPHRRQQHDWDVWLKVAGAFLVFFNIWGPSISFGVFQSFYTLDYLPNTSSSAVSWIGTIQAALLPLLGILAGPLYDLGYFHALFLAAALLTVFGLMMTSLSTTYYQLFLSQGICVGTGCGLLYVSTLTLVGVAAAPHQRALALGVVTSGIALAGIVYTIVFLRLLPQIGFAWTVRTIAFISLAGFIVAYPLLTHRRRRPTPSPSHARKLFTPAALHDAPFLVFTAGQFFVFCGYLVPLYYIPTYAQVVLGTDQSLAFYLLVASQAGSLVGRLLSGLPALRFGVMLPWVTCCAASSVICFAWIPATSLGSFAAIAVLYGLFSGAIVAFPAAAFPIICPDPQVLGSRMGLSWTVTAISFLVGAPVGGAVIDLENKNFVGLQVWSGVMIAVGTACFVVLWVIVGKKHGRVFV